MYINKIDEIINDIIDDIYNKIIINDERMEEIIREEEFEKYQKKINEIMIEYINEININNKNINKIYEIIKNNESKQKIIETIKKYIAIYIYLTIGYNYKGGGDKFIKNIIEISRKQTEYKIDNFFNSESNSEIINYYKIIKQIITLIESTQKTNETYIENQDYKESIQFLNELGNEYIENKFKIEDKKERGHNIIKTIIVLYKYKIKERKEIYTIIETAENIDNEYIYIDIVIPTKRVINFDTVENLLNKKEIMNGLAYDIWDFMIETNYDNIIYEEKNVNDKILELINNRIIVPIVDDFILYHKNSERYDKNIDIMTIKKREDTKIRYIINKIESVSELNSTNVNKENIKKQFDISLINRKAVIINNIEDMKIINKFISQGKKSIENEEYLNDLLQYQIYPYINFKESRNGFAIILNNTIDIIRGVSLERTGEFRQNPNNYLQLRIGSDDMIVNIIGFCIPTNKKSIECIKINNMIDIRTLEKKDGVDIIIKYINESIIKNKEHNASIYWLFDIERDRIILDTYEQTNKITTQDHIKHIISKMYDDIVNNIYKYIINKIVDKKMYIQIIKEMIYRIERRTIRITNNERIRNELETKIYENIIRKNEIEYDIKDDIIYGFSGEIIKLPEIKKENKLSYITININLAEINEEGKYEIKEKIEGICQHNVTWDRINEIKRTDKNKYIDDMYDFIQQYVIENAQQEYICKSCGFNLNIKKYIIDGAFDSETQKFITYSMPMDVPLEDIMEYSKYNILIRNIDKLIDKMANIINIQYFTGMTMTSKWKRKSIVKDVIDIILYNYNKLKNNYNERNEKTMKYGIIRNLSNFFIFELDNGIFIYSSKDKDKRKSIKQNNIIAYIIILLILELNESQLTYITNDKKGICNFFTFDRIYIKLFEGLNFLKNNKGDVVSVINYKIFCYILYIVICLISKYNMWNFEYKEADSKNINIRKKYMAIIQKTIVHTVIDIINSILENHESKSHIYEIIRSKFYNKLNTIFSNEELYKRFKSESIRLYDINKQKVLEKIEIFKLTGEYKNIYYDMPISWRKCRPPLLIFDKKYQKNIKYNILNNITNCINGQFHNWKVSKGVLECTICNIILKDIKINKEITEKIEMNYKYIILNNLANRYCFVGNSIIEELCKNKCIKCVKEEDYKYPNNELEQLKTAIQKNKNDKNEIEVKREKKNREKEKEENENNINIKSKLNDEYNNSTKNSKYNFINIFVDELIVSESYENNNFDLNNNIYIIDHDNIGNELNKEIIIIEKDNKIFYKSNHTFYKTDVIYYTSYIHGRIDVFYDNITHILLGYKEENKEYKLLKKPDKKIKIIYSIYNKLKYLGYPSQYIDITTKINNKISSKNDIIKETIKNIIRDRIDNLKEIIYKFQRIMIRIQNGNNKHKSIIKENIIQKDEIISKKEYMENEYDETDFFIDRINNIIEDHRQKIRNMTINDKNGENKIFKHWKGVTETIYQDIPNITINEEEELINIDIINSYDINGNILLYYIVNEMYKLIKYNDGKFIKINISMFFIDFINYIFDIYNQDTNNSLIDIKRFDYILNSSTYIASIQDMTGNVEGIYDEYKDVTEELTSEEIEEHEDALEEADAIDMDTEFDYISLYESTYDWEPDTIELRNKFTGNL